MRKTIWKEDNDSQEYYRESYMHGGGWHSRERGVVQGTVRVINDILSRAWTVRKRGLFGLGVPEIHWTSVNPKHIRDVDINERP